MLRGGGRAFAKKPKDWSFHVNRKMVHKGLMASLALRWVMGQLHIVDSETLPLWSKTRDAVSALEASPLGWTAERGTLLYLGQPTLQSSKGRALQLSTRNLPNVQVVDTLSSDTFNVYELLRPSRIAMDVEALNEVVHMLAPTVQDDLPFQLDELLLTEEANRKNQERETMTGGTELGQMTHEPSVLAQA